MKLLSHRLEICAIYVHVAAPRATQNALGAR